MTWSRPTPPEEPEHEHATDHPTPPRKLIAGAILAALLVTTACSSDDSTDASAEAASATDSDTGSEVFDADEVHEIDIQFDQDDYEAMIDAYADDGSKEWIEATITIDGTTYESAGIRLKGNSSLRGLDGDDRSGSEAGAPAGRASSDAPEELPWLIKLDKYVDDQHHDGVTDYVVRSNNSETALNEAVALELLEAAGLASQDAIAVRFSVGDSEETLRLVIEHPDDVWMADKLDADGALYKAESTGDYSYRGDDPDAYDEVFDQEAGKDNADLGPLIDFLDFINNSDDETFEAEIEDWLDVDAFATYLAMQDIVQNFDDINGPGNNSYLFYDTDNELFTVVPWDHNLAFGDAGFGIGPGPGNGAAPGGDGPQLPAGSADGIEPPAGPGGGEGFEPPLGGERAEGAEGLEPPTTIEQGRRPGEVDEIGANGAPGVHSNVLVERLLELEDFALLVEDRTAELTTALIDGGVAEEIVAAWVTVLEEGASDLVSSDAVADEAERLLDSL